MRLVIVDRLVIFLTHFDPSMKHIVAVRVFVSPIRSSLSLKCAGPYQVHGPETGNGPAREVKFEVRCHCMRSTRANIFTVELRIM
jgi:hypothetical protein